MTTIHDAVHQSHAAAEMGEGPFVEWAEGELSGKLRVRQMGATTPPILAADWRATGADGIEVTGRVAAGAALDLAVQIKEAVHEANKPRLAAEKPAAVTVIRALADEVETSRGWLTWETLLRGINEEHRKMGVEAATRRDAHLRHLRDQARIREQEIWRDLKAAREKPGATQRAELARLSDAIEAHEAEMMRYAPGGDRHMPWRSR